MANTEQWHALWTHSHSERLVHDQLAAKDFQVFLPEVEVWGRVRGARRARRVPLFPGYLFLRHELDKASYVAVSRTRGLVRVLGERWDRPAVVPDQDVTAIQRVLGTQLHPLPHPYLREGHRVRVHRGPLAGVEGILVESQPDRGLLVLSVDLFCRSLAVEIDCTLAGAA
ncbi:MAG TPA: transcription termination/antitermination NusG family protein [Candidatus Polarisedimenticolaceae bacterium]|nr:transcription termination/antitermination NusG family protein [Candidatus Polarisedimenticolaceae bacterium]